MIGKSRQRGIPDRTESEAIAAAAFAFIAEDAGRLGQFMETTGVDFATLRARLASGEMLEAALGYLLGDESALLTFAAGAGIAPERIAPALAILQRAER